MCPFVVPTLMEFQCRRYLPLLMAINGIHGRRFFSSPAPLCSPSLILYKNRHQEQRTPRTEQQARTRATLTRPTRPTRAPPSSQHRRPQPRRARTRNSATHAPSNPCPRLAQLVAGQSASIRCSPELRPCLHAVRHPWSLIEVRAPPSERIAGTTLFAVDATTQHTNWTIRASPSDDRVRSSQG